MLEETLTVAVLTAQEVLIDFLNPAYVQIEETNELYQLRLIKITHQLLDKQGTDLGRYDSILIAGNKIWRNTTCDGDSCLYVIRGPKTYDFTLNTVTVEAVEVAVELGEITVFRSDIFDWTVNSGWVTTYLDDLFDAGVLTGPATATKYNGTLTPLAMIQEIQTNTTGEFQYRYEYDPANKVIKRYIDYLTTIGKTHPTPIELGYNATGIELSIDESNVAIGVMPIGKPSGTSDEWHKNYKAWEDLAVTKGSSIPLYYTQDDNGDPVTGPNATAPYTKTAGYRHMTTDVTSDLVANYQHIHYKEGSSSNVSRKYPYESSEDNPTNRYWEAVKEIRNRIYPEIEIKCSILDLEKLAGETGELYNVGDTIYIILPGRTNSVQCRITKSVKDPRSPEEEEIEISTNRSKFTRTYYHPHYIHPGGIDVE